MTTSGSLAVGARVYVIAESAPPCRAGTVQIVHAEPVNGASPKLRGYRVLHDAPEPDTDGFIARLFHQTDKRDWTWAPSEVVPFERFEQVVEACHGDVTRALAELRNCAGGVP